MEVELQPPEALISTIPPPTTAPSTDPPQLDPSTTAATNPPKRQRRPSVRLGEIGGDLQYDSHPRRINKTWRFHKDPALATKASKTRPLTNLVNGVVSAEPSENYADFSNRIPKTRKPTRRARTNWNKFDSTTVNNAFQEENEDFREIEAEGSESPLLKEHQSPVNSVENMGLQFWDQQRRGKSESNGVLHHEVNSHEEKQSEGSVGVKEWLIGLGLGKYSPVFEIHEVDDEVLPMLTLEDLKDMGISATSDFKTYALVMLVATKCMNDSGSCLKTCNLCKNKNHLGSDETG
ncbi:hypothetical protein ACJIZ3_004641 [Penstemon smallii]|uniref:SAM domain-containing protein n=1 Tax=Penstemon smallii TaxID=265156 RepID=A0ABD3S2N6_9LAMI